MTTKLSELWPTIARIAEDEGVVRLGAAELDDAHATLFDEWIEQGLHASMAYLVKNRAARLDPRTRFPWAQSAIVILVPYAPHRPPAPPGALSHHLARYALGDDYHEVLDGILARIETVVKTFGRTWRYVDTGPLSDRALAANAGLGWIGKNGMLIDDAIGSYVFIGTLLTSLENDIATATVADRCGSCTHCLDACPTNAILPNRTVASDRCISYATIEHRGPLPPGLPLAGNAFGCDICQDVCPWNAAPTEGHPAFAPREAYRATPITDLLQFAHADFSTLFRKSAIKRAKLEGMRRNVEAVTSSQP